VSSEPSSTPAELAEPGLVVRVRFKLEDEDGARMLAGRLIDRAHELANLTECECDLDVDVEWTPTAPPASTSGSTPAEGGAVADPESAAGEGPGLGPAP
jgi:hypothetical protein